MNLEEISVALNLALDALAANHPSLPRLTAAFLPEGELRFAALTTDDELRETWTYYALDSLHASTARVSAYATALCRAVMEADAASSLAEAIPHPALLALEELRSSDDFFAARLDVDLEIRACDTLRA